LRKDDLLIKIHHKLRNHTSKSSTNCEKDDLLIKICPKAIDITSLWKRKLEIRAHNPQDQKGDFWQVITKLKSIDKTWISKNAMISCAKIVKTTLNHQVILGILDQKWHKMSKKNKIQRNLK